MKWIQRAFVVLLAGSILYAMLGSGQCSSSGTIIGPGAPPDTIIIPPDTVVVGPDTVFTPPDTLILTGPCADCMIDCIESRNGNSQEFRDCLVDCDCG